MVSNLVSQYILIALSLTFNGNKLYKTLGFRIRDTLNFDFLEKNPGIFTTFWAWFFKKLFLMLYSIDSPGMIV